MNEGGDKSMMQSECNVGGRAWQRDYGRAVARVAVAQVCEGVGFECFRDSALEALSDVGVRFMCDVGKSASSYATLAGRAECNLFDIIAALEDLGMAVGFSGASEVGHCPLGSGIVNEIMEFVETVEGIPFVQQILQFPVIKSRKGTPSFSQMGEAPGGNHVMDWLPAFPEPQTYIHLPVWDDRRTDPQGDRVEHPARQRRRVEMLSLLNLQQRLLSSCSAGPSGTVSHRYADQGCTGSDDDAMEVPVPAENRNQIPAPTLQTADSTHTNSLLHATQIPYDMFLAPPFSAGEKDVSPICSPGRIKRKEDDKIKYGSALEVSRPASDAMKSGVNESVGSERLNLPERRPVVQFSLKGGSGRKVGV